MLAISSPWSLMSSFASCIALRTCCLLDKRVPSEDVQHGTMTDLCLTGLVPRLTYRMSYPMYLASSRKVVSLLIRIAYEFAGLVERVMALGQEYGVAVPLYQQIADWGKKNL